MGPEEAHVSTAMVHGLGPPEHGPLEDLSLYVRTYNALRGAGLMTTDAICAQTRQQLLALKNFGRVSLADLEQALEAQGLALASRGAHACPWCRCPRGGR